MKGERFLGRVFMRAKWTIVKIPRVGLTGRLLFIAGKVVCAAPQRGCLLLSWRIVC